MVKNPPANAGDIRDTGSVAPPPGVQAMATHSSILAWRIPWTGAWRATVHGVANSWT